MKTLFRKSYGLEKSFLIFIEDYNRSQPLNFYQPLFGYNEPKRIKTDK